MSRPSTQQDRSRRRKAAVVITIAVLLIAGWIAAIAVLAGNGGEQARTPDAGGGQPSEDGADPAGGQPSSGSGGDSGSSDSSGGPSEEEVENAADEVLSEPPGGGVPDGEVAIEVEEGRSNGQRGFVASFVGKAYGYTGEVVKAYRAGYEPYIDTETYYDSAGGAVLEEYAAMVEDGGAENAAVLEEYRITSGEPVKTQVNEAELEQFAPPKVMEGGMPEGASLAEVTYAVGDRYGDPSKGEDFGKVYGDVDYLKQRLFLSREQGGWTIRAASAPLPTEAPERPDPDAPKVMEPQGPKGHRH